MRDWERASRHGGVGREKGVELQACPLPKPATFLHPESQEMRGGRGACGVSISRPQPSLRAIWWEKKHLQECSGVRARAGEHMESGLISFVQ